MDRTLDNPGLDRALASLAYRLDENAAAAVEIVVCGGSALILTGMVPRTTKDVDIVALLSAGTLCSPDPLPEELQKAAQEVAEDLALPRNWLNFKLYAAVDRGGYHVEDLRALKPTPSEMEAAAKWTMTHDVSAGFRMVLRRFLKEFGYANLAEQL